MPAKLLLIIITAFWLCQETLADPVQVEFFTDSRQFPVTGENRDVTLVTYDLAAPELLTQGLGSGLPADPDASLTLAKQRLAANKASLEGQLKSAYLGHTRAMDYGLAKYPAMVFAGKAVIYGVTDLHEGLARYRDWLRSGHP